AHRLDRFDEEPDRVALRQPVNDARRQHEVLIPVAGQEILGQPHLLEKLRPCDSEGGRPRTRASPAQNHEGVCATGCIRAIRSQLRLTNSLRSGCLVHSPAWSRSDSVASERRASPATAWSSPTPARRGTGGSSRTSAATTPCGSPPSSRSTVPEHWNGS